MDALPFHTRHGSVFFSILAMNDEGVKLEGRFSFAARRSGGGERGVTPDRNKEDV